VRPLDRTLRAARGTCLVALVAVLAGCGTWSPTKTRPSAHEPLRTADIVHAPKDYGASASTNAAAPVQTPAAPTVAAQPEPAATAGPVAQSAPAAPALLAEVAQPVTPKSDAAAAAGAPAPAPAPLAPGRWSVQVGVFAVPANAQKDRVRVESRLAQSDIAPAQRIVRVERIADRSHVLVGDLPDRAAVQALAAQLRRLLRQDVVVLRR
jgi:hypothetical protein